MYVCLGTVWIDKPDIGKLVVPSVVQFEI